MKKSSEAIKVENLDHYRLGRALDKYHQRGITQLFTAIAIKAAEKFGVKKVNKLKPGIY